MWLIHSSPLNVSVTFFPYIGGKWGISVSSLILIVYRLLIIMQSCPFCNALFGPIKFDKNFRPLKNQNLKWKHKNIRTDPDVFKTCTMIYLSSQLTCKVRSTLSWADLDNLRAKNMCINHKLSNTTYEEKYYSNSQKKFTKNLLTWSILPFYNCLLI